MKIIIGILLGIASYCVFAALITILYYILDLWFKRK